MAVQWTVSDPRSPLLSWADTNYNFSTAWIVLMCSTVRDELNAPVSAGCRFRFGRTGGGRRRLVDQTLIIDHCLLKMLLALALKQTHSQQGGLM